MRVEVPYSTLARPWRSSRKTSSRRRDAAPLQERAISIAVDYPPWT
uniref:Uncharacterized protein n=1 Tax=Arundo donax TaxID=35708 RepID=A0A0A8YSR0_ARUDO